ncbi:Rhodanese-related sulfurtransferase [Variovorax sp. HW608]|uniref:rhodanese-like domain-containing protein n=1 Tax=Variovorax sp. HW608 TaxID=1034889 RepID=UPI00082012FA|nr:rhodanese-like domain-containing protein [Variovorax sp. HW608]SCK25962.1 Rhodanese-related sulfurtransferase [Variovorax sp. HW608]
MTATISPLILKAWLHDGGEIALLDVREHGQFGESHLFYAVPLPFSRLELDIWRLVPRNSVRCVVYDSGAHDSFDVARRAAARLEALGWTNVCVLEGGTRAWQAAGYALFAGVNLPSKSFGELAEHAYRTPRISADDLAQRLARGEQLVVLDGRPFSEFRKMNIPTALCCPNGELPYRIKSIVPDESTPIVVNCAGRTRSIIGAQTLINLGLRNPVYALENGTQGWYLRDHALEHGGTRTYAPDSGTTVLRDNARKLAARFSAASVDAATVREWAAQHDRTLYLCDVRMPEEFAQGSLPGAQHTPGGQLMQAFDQYVGVRGARLVLFDDDGVRAPTVASWLRQMGHEAWVLQEGLASGLALPSRTATQSPPAPARIDAIEAARLADRHEIAIIDLRGSMEFRKAHIAGATWTIRPRLAEALRDERRPVVIVADDDAAARWAVETEWPQTLPQPLLLKGGLPAWRQAGLPVEATTGTPPDADCIDFLFFVHDRHDGNKEAARRYLAWETGLVAQLDDQEIAAFRLPAAERSHDR